MEPSRPIKMPDSTETLYKCLEWREITQGRIRKANNEQCQEGLNCQELSERLIDMTIRAEVSKKIIKSP